MNNLNFKKSFWLRNLIQMYLARKKWLLLHYWRKIIEMFPKKLDFLKRSVFCALTLKLNLGINEYFGYFLIISLHKKFNLQSKTFLKRPFMHKLEVFVILWQRTVLLLSKTFKFCVKLRSKFKIVITEF